MGSRLRGFLVLSLWSVAMKVSQIAFLLSLAAMPAAVSADTDPLGKVYELMDSLAAKITKEGEEEAKAIVFTSYSVK